MKLKSMRCPNCDGMVKELPNNRCYCDSCGTSFMIDMDPEDVEFERLKSEGVQVGGRTSYPTMGAIPESGKKYSRRGSYNSRPAMVVFVAIATMMIIATCVVALFMRSLTRSMREEQIRQESAAIASMSEEMRSGAMERDEEDADVEYVTSPDQILADEAFMELINQRCLVFQDSDRGEPYSTSTWEWAGEPQYVTSYLLTANNESAREQVRLINIYEVTWNKIDEDGEATQFVVYDALGLSNISIGDDGSIVSDDIVSRFAWFNMVDNVFLYGNQDMDQLVAEVVTAETDFTATEFTMPLQQAS